MRNYFDCRIRRFGPETFDLAYRFHAGPAHEGHVRRTHGIGVAGKPATRLGAAYAAELILFDILRQKPGEAHRYAPVYVSCRRVLSPQLSPYELITVPVVWHEEQLISGNFLANEGHALILTIADHQRPLTHRVLGLCHLACV